MNELIHLRISRTTCLPVCWIVSGPLPVNQLAEDTRLVTCHDCLDAHHAPPSREKDLSGLDDIEYTQYLIDRLTK